MEKIENEVINNLCIPKDCPFTKFMKSEFMKALIGKLLNDKDFELALFRSGMDKESITKIKDKIKELEKYSCSI